MGLFQYPVSAMLMAAGLGTRLQPFTDLEPKALLPVMGIPCAGFALEGLSRAGVLRVVANVHPHAARAGEGLKALAAGVPGVELEISDESALLLGSAGGIAKALPALGREPFFLVNADVICDVDLAALARSHRRLRGRHGVKLTLAVFARAEGGGSYREILMDPDPSRDGDGPFEGKIRGLGPVAAGRPYFVGVAVVEPEAFEGIGGDRPSELVSEILEPAIREGKAGFFLSSGCWLDIGSPELWAGAHFELIRRLETGRLPPSWRHRIEKDNRRIGQRSWIFARVRRRFAIADEAAPAYFNDLGDSTARPPRCFGPYAVLYGAAPSLGAGERFENRIGFRGLFHKLG